MCVATVSSTSVCGYTSDYDFYLTISNDSEYVCMYIYIYICRMTIHVLLLLLVSDLEMIFNGIITLILMVSEVEAESVVTLFCEKVSKALTISKWNACRLHM